MRPAVVTSTEKVGHRHIDQLCPPQTLVALRRVHALQQRGSGAAPGATLNPPAGLAEEQKDRAEYTDQDRKILQLCGEGRSAEQGPSWRGGAGHKGVGRCRGRSRTRIWKGWLWTERSGGDPWRRLAGK
jgi:hypothetical protein